MESIERIKLMVQVAKMYYEYEQTQQEIANQLEISRPTVSRLLAQCRQEGIVQISIHNPLGYCSDLEEIFREKFGLKEVIISPLTGDDQLKLLAEVAAKYLYRIVKDGDILGVAWGNTLQNVSKVLKRKKLSNIKVVQMKGGMGVSGSNIHASQIVEKFSEAYSGKAFFLPVPAIVDTGGVKEAFLSDRSLKRTLEVAGKVNVAIFSIGALTSSAAQVEAGYLTLNEVQSLQSKGAVGDICSRFFTLDGEIADPVLDKRTIGINLEELSSKDYSIAIARGKEKAAGILGALRGGFFNVLITDEETATQVLDMGEFEYSL